MQPFEDLHIIAARRYPVLGTNDEVGIYKGLIDSGYKTDKVYNFVIKSGYKFIPIKGKAEGQGMFAPWRQTSVALRGLNIPLILCNDTHFKNLLYLTTIKERMNVLHFPQDTDDELKLQLTSERLVTKPDKRGHMLTDWYCGNRRNHLGDCFKYIETFKEVLEPRLAALRKEATELRQRAKEGTPAPATEINVVEEPQKRQYALNGAWGSVDSWD